VTAGEKGCVFPPVDVQVVGGGPAGLAFAARAARDGRSVRVLDRRRPPLDKPCGEGLMPDGVAVLEELGIDVAALPGRPFRGIRWLGDGPGKPVVDGAFPARPGLGIRRTVLHDALVRRAEEAGVELCWGVKVTGARVEGDGAVAETGAGESRSRYLVAADGLRSPLRRLLGLDAGPGRHRRYGIRRHFRVAPWTDRVEVYWIDGSEAYVTPVADQETDDQEAGEVGVAILWREGDPAAADGFDGLLERYRAPFPDFVERLTAAEPTSRDRGCGSLHQRARRVVFGPVALLGDASGYLDAITGEGLSLALHQGVALAEALRVGDLGRYESAQRRLRRLPDGLTRLLLAVERRPALRHRLLRTLARDPSLFDRLLAIHTRDRPLLSLGLGNGVRLGWGLARPAPPT
jgi:menaquinone-9 beta-reductase